MVVGTEWKCSDSRENPDREFLERDRNRAAWLQGKGKDIINKRVVGKNVFRGNYRLAQVRPGNLRERGSEQLGISHRLTKN